MKRRILLILAAAGCCAHASVTKVGNGDDGADLEALTPVTSGPVWQAREMAIHHVIKLNVMGVPGLGSLLPELERSDLLMAASDVRQTNEADGSLEVSETKKLIYARTFAEPYAATRFFPAAAKLSGEQLMALHIHEALHRSLPADIREDENAVTHITLALTSPGASFDRAKQVAGLYLKPKEPAALIVPVATTQMKVTAPEPSIPKASASKAIYTFDIYQAPGSPAGIETYSHGAEFGSSLGGYRRIGFLVSEPYIRVRLKTGPSAGQDAGPLGPSAYDLAFRFKTDSESIVAPFFRFTARSLNEFDYRSSDRDIRTLGVAYELKHPKAYLQGQMFYSFGSASRDFSSRMEYKPIFSVSAAGGWNWPHWRLGGIAEIHSSEGKEYVPGEGSTYNQYDNTTLTKSGFRILVLGQELSYRRSWWEVKVYSKAVASSTILDLSDLGDTMDRGSGKIIYGLAASAVF